MNPKRKKRLDREAVIARLRKVQGDRSDRAFALSLEISPAYLSDIYAGLQAPGPKVLEHLGLRRVLMYEEAEAA